MSNSRNQEMAQQIVAALLMGNNDMDYTRAIAASLNEESAYKNVLSDEGENQLIERTFTESDKEQSTCPIMHIPFEVGDKITELPCGHIFDSDGIRKWLKDEKAECPVCRYKMKAKEVKNENAPDTTEDNNEIISGRNSFIDNLRRVNSIPIPQIYSAHPFGPSTTRIANIVHEEDDANDLMRAIITTISAQQGRSARMESITNNYHHYNYNINPFTNIIVNDVSFFDISSNVSDHLDDDNSLD